MIFPGVLAQQALLAGGGGGGPPAIGQAYGGGYYLGNITVPSGADAGTYAVIISEDAGEAPSTLRWKPTGTTTAGTTSLVNGLANTLAMIAAGSHPAAAACDSYAGGGFNDWYLPAKDELNLAWTNRAALTGITMQSALYWSSSESGAATAWCQVPTNGSQFGAQSKTALYRVRPVRRILI